MFVSKLWRVVGVVGFVAAGYVGCTCTPPPNNGPLGEKCINAGTQPATWSFVDKECGCRPGSVLCPYEASVMRCFAAADVTNYTCAQLPPVDKGSSDKGTFWKRLDLTKLQLAPGAMRKIRACIEDENRKPVNNSCPIPGARPVYPHFLPSCSPEPTPPPSPTAAADTSEEARGGAFVLASDNCGGDDCCQDPNSK